MSAVSRSIGCTCRPRLMPTITLTKGVCSICILIFSAQSTTSGAIGASSVAVFRTHAVLHYGVFHKKTSTNNPGNQLLYQAQYVQVWNNKWEKVLMYMYDSSFAGPNVFAASISTFTPSNDAWAKRTVLEPRCILPWPCCTCEHVLRQARIQSLVGIDKGPPHTILQIILFSEQG